jgi:hypothetical protein
VSLEEVTLMKKKMAEEKQQRLERMQNEYWERENKMRQ